MLGVRCESGDVMGSVPWGREGGFLRSLFIRTCQSCLSIMIPFRVVVYVGLRNNLYNDLFIVKTTVFIRGDGDPHIFPYQLLGWSML